MTITRQEVRNALNRRLVQSNYDIEVDGVTGRLNPDGSLHPNPRVDDRENHLWVRLNGSRTAVPILNVKGVDDQRAGIHVKLRKLRSGIFEIAGIDSETEDALRPNEAAGLARRSIPSGLNGDLINISSLNQFRVTRQGWLWVVGGGVLSGSIFAGGETHAYQPSLSLPASGKEAPYYLGINRSTLALAVAKGADVTIDTFTASNIDASSALGNGVLALAVAVINPDTIALQNVSDSLIWDLRGLLDESGSAQANQAHIPRVIASGTYTIGENYDRIFLGSLVVTGGGLTVTGRAKVMSI